MMSETDKDDFSVENAILGESSQVFKLNSVDEYRIAALSLAEQARHRIQIFSPDLEALLYDSEDFSRALAQVANYHPTSLVQILIKDGSTAVKGGHRLVALCQRFTSYIKVRRIAEEYQDKKEAFMLADKAGLLYRAHEDSYQGFVNFNAADTVNKLTRQFAEIWEHSLPEKDFRRMFI